MPPGGTIDNRAIVHLYRLVQDLVRRALRARMHAYEVWLVWNRNRVRPYAAFIGFNSEGLWRARMMSLLVRAPITFFSLEMMLTSEIDRRYELKLKPRERRHAKRAPVIVTQQLDRARLLSEDLGIPLDRFVEVPNAPLGPARRHTSSPLHKMVGISEGARVVLHSGSANTWTRLEEIVASVNRWPPGWVLVIHSPSGGPNLRTVDLFRDQTSDRVFLSDAFLPADEYQRFVGGADIGIAFYRVTSPVAGNRWWTQSNVPTMGVASGKVASYLHAGLPVIVNDDIPLAREIEGCCGVAVSGANEIGAAITLIEANYEELSIAACSLFEERFDFRKSFAEVMARMIPR